MRFDFLKALSLYVISIKVLQACTSALLLMFGSVHDT